MAAGVCVLLGVCVCACVAFNLDTSFPLLKTGERGSLFGFSVALHQDLKTQGYLLLVGAPREKAEPNVPANRTGGVYSCPISADQSDCRRMKLIDPATSQSDDLVEDMWLGVSVASQGPPGGRVLVCGHRFVKLYGAFELRHMIGRCYIRGNNLQYDEDDANWQDPEQPCSHLGDVTGEVMCTMGISASITQREVIVGSPGSFEWEGNVHVSWMKPDDHFNTQKSSFSKKDHRNIYIGYSVTQAPRLLSEEEETIITGAPRDRMEDARGSVLLAVKHADKLMIQQTLRGQQMGSYFGNAVATTDLNSDGWNDLLVGAPFYFDRKEEVGGAVYVYMNAGRQFDSRPSVVLKGPEGSAFGMAVAAAGDLNQDGFQDFAVGAPYHDTGSVMIWTGSSDGIRTAPSQVIRGSSVSPVFTTFGYSLTARGDVDGNSYPDLLVGSLDDTVALLRSRPVIHLNKTLQVSPDIVDLNSCDFCIQVEVCFSYMLSRGQKSDRDNITVHFTLTADQLKDPLIGLKPRLRFQDNGQNVYSDYLSMPKDQCRTLRVGLLSQIRDKVKPLVFSLNVSLYEKLPKKTKVVQDLKHLPVLSEIPLPTRTQIHIRKACGSDNRCHSNLQMMAQFTDENQKPFTKLEGTQVLPYNFTIKRLFLEVNVSNTPSPGRPAEDAHNAILNISIPPSLIYSGVEPKVVECSVEENLLLCELGDPFRSNQQVQVWIKFQPSEISLDTREIRSLLQLSTLSEQSDLSPLSVSMLVEYSLQTSLTLIPLQGPALFTGHVIGESAMRKAEDIGSLLRFTFQVHVHGKPLGHLGSLEMEFDWPMEVANGKWLLYLEEIQVNGTSESRCSPAGNIINPLNLKLSEEKRKMKRSLDEVMEEDKQKDKTLPVLHLKGKKRKFYRLECGHGAKCVKFICPLVNMNNSATLTIRARLWNATMIEDYSDASKVLVLGQATLKLQTNKPTINMKPHSSKIEVEIYPDSELQVDSGAPLWIIVVSVLAGVLLLALICLLLWKCGFFRRASTRELYQAKTQKAHMKSQPSEKDRLTEEL